MAKYRVYLKDGLGVFVADAKRIALEDCYYALYGRNNFVALFDKESVLAIIDTDKADRVFASGGVVSEENIKFPYIVNYYTKKEGEAEC